MQLTPDDIQKQQFNIRFRGFDVGEVDNFLKKVGEDYLLLTTEKRELEEKVTRLETQLSEFREREKTFQNAILSTQKVADEIEEKSRQEAEHRLQEAQEEAERIRSEAHTEVVSLKKQVKELKETKNGTKKELKEFFQSYLDLLGEEPSEEFEQPVILSGATAAGLQKEKNDEKQSDKEELPEAAPKTAPKTPASEPETAPKIPASEPETTHEAAPEAAASEEEDSLYEKIDLPDDLPGMTDPGEETETEGDDLFTDHFAGWEDAGDEKGHPALDGEVLFDLEDPVDYEQEPAVIVDDASSEDSEKSKKWELRPKSAGK